MSLLIGFSVACWKEAKSFTQRRWLGCRINTNLVALRKSNKQESKSGASDRERFASKKSAESSPAATSGSAERQFFFFNYASGYDLVGAVWQIRRRSHPIHRITKSAETAGVDWKDYRMWLSPTFIFSCGTHANMKGRGAAWIRRSGSRSVASPSPVIIYSWPPWDIDFYAHGAAALFNHGRVPTEKLHHGRIIARRTPFAPAKMCAAVFLICF